MKRVFTLMLALLLLLSLFGCGRTQKEQTPDETRWGQVWFGSKTFRVMLPYIEEHAFWVEDDSILAEHDAATRGVDYHAPISHTIVWGGQTYQGNFRATGTYADGFSYYSYGYGELNWRVNAETGRVIGLYNVPEAKDLGDNDLWLTEENATDDALTRMVMSVWPDFADERCDYAVTRDGTTYCVICTPPADKNPAGEQLNVTIRARAGDAYTHVPTETDGPVVSSEPDGIEDKPGALNAYVTTREDRDKIERFDEEARRELLTAFLSAHLTRGWQMEDLTFSGAFVTHGDSVLWAVSGWVKVNATSKCSRKEVKQEKNSIQNEKGIPFRFLFQIT